MSLKDFIIAREEVAFQGGSLSIRGLSLNDFALLMRDYLVELNALFVLYEKEESRDTAAAQSAKFAITLVKETPQLVAQLIVLCSDGDQEDIAIAEKLPLPLQVEVIRKCIEITFEEAGGAKKFLDSLMGMVGAIRPKTLSGD